MASQRLPREPCHSCSRRGRGACGRSSCINVGVGTGPPESLGQFADDADQGRVLILEPLVVSPEVRQSLWDGTGSAGGPGQAEPMAYSAHEDSPSAPPPAPRPFAPGPCAPVINGEGESKALGVREGQRLSRTEKGYEGSEVQVRRSVWPPSSTPAWTCKAGDTCLAPPQLPYSQIFPAPEGQASLQNAPASGGDRESTEVR